MEAAVERFSPYCRGIKSRGFGDNETVSADFDDRYRPGNHPN